MPISLPTEVLLSICEQTRSDSDGARRKSRVGTQLDVFNPYLLGIREFSCASRRFREVAAPLLFQHVCIRTREQVVSLVKSPLLVNVRHVHFPSINILTSRRPLGSHILTLVQQATSIKLASSEPAFYTDIPRYLGGLLPALQYLSGIEIYYGSGINLPHVDPTAVLAEFITTLNGVETLAMRLPGGRPSFMGIQTLFNRTSVPTNPLVNLKHLFLSHQLPLQLALSPEDLALSLARRLPKLKLIAMATPKKGMSNDMSIWGLGGPGAHPPSWGMSGGELKVWEVRRTIESGELGEREVTSVVEVVDDNPRRSNESFERALF